jgi:hypothetical protein
MCLRTLRSPSQDLPVQGGNECSQAVGRELMGRRVGHILHIFMQMTLHMVTLEDTGQLMRKSLEATQEKDLPKEHHRESTPE